MSNAWRLFLEISILIFVTWFLLNSTVTLSLSSNRINGNCVEQHFQNHLFLSILEHQQMMFSESEVVVFRWIRVRNGTINYSFSFFFSFYVSVVHISILCVSGKNKTRAIKSTTRGILCNDIFSRFQGFTDEVHEVQLDCWKCMKDSRVG